MLLADDCVQDGLCTITEAETSLLARQAMKGILQYIHNTLFEQIDRGGVGRCHTREGGKL